MPLIVSPRGRRFMQMERLASGFTGRVASHEQAAADAATAESKAVYERWKSGRPTAPPRAGRPTTEGEFPGFLRWKRDGHGGISFDKAELEEHAPYWLIQEIGTGQSARILNPAGQVTVRSQKGRRIPMSLMWADGPGSNPTPPMTGLGTQQLYLASSFEGKGSDGGEQMISRRAGRIRREIKGKHFIRDGGLLGMQTLRDELFTDARRTFS